MEVKYADLKKQSLLKRMFISNCSTEGKIEFIFPDICKMSIFKKLIFKHLCFIFLYMRWINELQNMENVENYFSFATQLYSKNPGFYKFFSFKLP